MQMLAAGGFPVFSDDARPPDPDNPRGYFECEFSKQLPRDASWLHRARGRAVKLISELVLTLPPVFPYRFLLVSRDWGEVVRSQDAVLMRRGTPGGDWVAGRLARVYAAQFAELEDWLTARPQSALLRVDYNALLCDPAPAVEAIATFLDASMDRAAMAAVVEPGLYRQRRAAPEF